MRIKLIKIGNSMGVRLPKGVIQACGLGTEAELSVADGQIILAPADGVRATWQQAFEVDVKENPVRERGEWEW